MSSTNEHIVLDIQSGNNELLGELYSRNLPYIKHLVRRFSGRNDFDDLCQEAYFGLVQAVKHWDSDLEVPFIMYAKYWIINQITRYKSQFCFSVRLPSHMYEKIMKYKKIRSGIEQNDGIEPTPEIVLNKMSLSQVQKDELRRVLYHLSHSVSMDSPIPDSETNDLLRDFVPDPSDNDIDLLLDEIERKELETMLWNIVDDLHGQEPEVLHMRYQEGLSLKACAVKLNVTTERVRQIELSGLQRIRRRNMNQLRPFLHDVIFHEAYSCSGLNKFRSNGFESSVERSVERIEQRRESMMKRVCF